jgi:hypothetical protein
MACPVTKGVGMETSAVSGAPLLLLRLEGAGVLVVAIAIYAHLGLNWWLFALLFFTPDLSMLGYLAGPRIGAIAYNAIHTYIAPALLGAFGVLAGSQLMLGLAVIWVGHIGFDRVFGYGLKYASSFGDTHLGRIGRAK